MTPTKAIADASEQLKRMLSSQEVWHVCVSPPQANCRACGIEETIAGLQGAHIEISQLIKELDQLKAALERAKEIGRFLKENMLVMNGMCYPLPEHTRKYEAFQKADELIALLPAEPIVEQTAAQKDGK